MNSLSYGSRTDRDERGIPVVSAALHPRYCGLRAAVERLRAAGVAVCLPLEIREWNGAARHGRFVQIDATTCALDVGRGAYVTLDIQRDLNGITPNEATNAMLCRSGAVREPDSHAAYNPAYYAPSGSSN